VIGVAQVGALVLLVAVLRQRRRAVV
jgi:hypothetical protein